MTLWKWSQTSATNATSDSTINWSEGQSPSSVNDSARAMMAATAKYRDDTSGKLDDGGSANAYAITSNEVITSNLDGFRVSFRAANTNTAASTLSVDSQTAKPLRILTGVDLVGGEIVEGSVYDAVYRSDTLEWLLVGCSPSIIPSGIIVDYGGATAPAGWLLCYGQAISRTTYAPLFTAIGTTYGTGDGSTTFNLPDKRGRVSAGQDDMGGSSADRLTNQSGGLNGDTLGATGGAETVTLDATMIPSHTHTASVTDPGHTHVLKGASDSNTDGQYIAGNNQNTTSGNHVTESATTGISVSNSSTGGGGAHNNVQPTIILNSIIKI